MKDEVIIHIGLHKTGTTTIQKFMYENKNSISNYEFVCRDKNGIDRTDGNSYFLLDTSDFHKEESRKFNLDIHTLISNVRHSNRNSVIISTEAFSWISDIGELSKLKDELYKVAKKVTIICYVRKLIDFSKSVYSEACKPLNTLSSLHEFRYMPFDLRLLNNDFIKNYYTYNNLVVWKEVFRDSNVIMRPFNKLEWVYENLIVDFLSCINVKDDNLLSKALVYQSSNKSLSKLQIIYMATVKRVFNKFSIKKKHYFESLLFRNIEFLKTTDSYCFNMSDAIKFQNHIKNELDSNEKIIGLSLMNEFDRALENRADIIEMLKVIDVVKLLVYGAYSFLLISFAMTKYAFIRFLKI
ncbi:hypothetical protein AB4304_01860 [Vibrio breoganii]